MASRLTLEFLGNAAAVFSGCHYFCSSVYLHEQVSAPWAAEVELIVDQALSAEALSSLLQGRARLTMVQGLSARQQLKRQFSGIITKVSSEGMVLTPAGASLKHSICRYRLTLSSPLVLLSLNQRTRTFSSLSVPEALQHIAADYPELKLDFAAVDLSYFDSLQIIVQRAESDFTLWQRLCAQSGLNYCAAFPNAQSESQLYFSRGWQLHHGALALIVQNESVTPFYGALPASLGPQEGCATLEALHYAQSLGLEQLCYDPASSSAPVLQRAEGRAWGEYQRLFQDLPQLRQEHRLSGNFAQSARSALSAVSATGTDLRLCAGHLLFVADFYGSSAQLLVTTSALVLRDPFPADWAIPSQLSPEEMLQITWSGQIVARTRLPGFLGPQQPTPIDAPAASAPILPPQAVPELCEGTVCTVEGNTTSGDAWAAEADTALPQLFWVLLDHSSAPVPVRFTLPLGGSAQLLHYPQPGDRVLVVISQGRCYLQAFLPQNNEPTTFDVKKRRRRLGATILSQTIAPKATAKTTTSQSNAAPTDAQAGAQAASTTAAAASTEAPASSQAATPSAATQASPADQGKSKSESGSKSSSSKSKDSSSDKTSDPLSDWERDYPTEICLERFDSATDYIVSLIESQDLDDFVLRMALEYNNQAILKFYAETKNANQGKDTLQAACKSARATLRQAEEKLVAAERSYVQARYALDCAADEAAQSKAQNQLQEALSARTSAQTEYSTALQSEYNLANEVVSTLAIGQFNAKPQLTLRSAGNMVLQSHHAAVDVRGRNIRLSSDGSICILGGKIKLSAAESIELNAGSSGLLIDHSGVTLKAAKTALKGESSSTILSLSSDKLSAESAALAFKGKSSIELKDGTGGGITSSTGKAVLNGLSLSLATIEKTVVTKSLTEQSKALALELKTMVLEALTPPTTKVKLVTPCGEESLTPSLPLSTKMVDVKEEKIDKDYEGGGWSPNGDNVYVPIKRDETRKKMSAELKSIKEAFNDRGTTKQKLFKLALHILQLSAYCIDLATDLIMEFNEEILDKKLGTSTMTVRQLIQILAYGLKAEVKIMGTSTATTTLAAFQKVSIEAMDNQLHIEAKNFAELFQKQEDGAAPAAGTTSDSTSNQDEKNKDGKEGDKAQDEADSKQGKEGADTNKSKLESKDEGKDDKKAPKKSTELKIAEYLQKSLGERPVDTFTEQFKQAKAKVETFLDDPAQAITDQIDAFKQDPCGSLLKLYQSAKEIANSEAMTLLNEAISGPEPEKKEDEQKKEEPKKKKPTSKGEAIEQHLEQKLEQYLGDDPLESLLKSAKSAQDTIKDNKDALQSFAQDPAGYISSQVTQKIEQFKKDPKQAVNEIYDGLGSVLANKEVQFYADVLTTDYDEGKKAQTKDGKDGKGADSKNPAKDSKAADSKDQTKDDKAADSKNPAKDDKATDSKNQVQDDKGSDSKDQAQDDKAADSKGNTSQDDRPKDQGAGAQDEVNQTKPEDQTKPQSDKEEQA